MAFLGKLAAFGARFLGAATKASRFVGANIGNIQKAARTVSTVANNEVVKRLGGSVGIKPSVFKAVGDVAGQVSQNLPGSIQAANNVVTTTKRNLGDLYAAVNRAT
jgi:hypothetical protein